MVDKIVFGIGAILCICGGLAILAIAIGKTVDLWFSLTERKLSVQRARALMLAMRNVGGIEKATEILVREAANQG